MLNSSPDPRYFKDGMGLEPTWRYALRYPRQYAWMKQPRWLRAARIRRRDSR